MSVTVVEWLANFGVAGIVVVLLATGILVPGYIYKDALKAMDKVGDALAIERQRNADLQQLASLGTKAMTALADVAEDNRRRQGGSPVPPEMYKREGDPV